MFPTSYTDLQAIAKTPGPYVGGICKWWYIPIEWLQAFAPINPANQLMDEPRLSAGGWFGPVNVPEQKTGWEQTQQLSPAGSFYTQKFTAFIPGHSAAALNNIANLSHHQFCIVAKLRAGGNYIILGNPFAGLSLTINNQSGTGSKETPGTSLIFTGEQSHSAVILNNFRADIQRNPRYLTINGMLVLVNNSFLIIR